MVVEDVPHILELLEVTLRFKGYPVVTARNGEEALEQIAKERPAMVITDILMPKLDGYALVYKLLSDPQTRSIPVVFLSATYITAEDKKFGLKLGAVRFLEKPIDTDEFLLTVAEVLTEGLVGESPSLNEEAFYRGYRERLEDKLTHKIKQIARTKRLLETLPEEQKPSFRAMLEDSRQQREEIQEELDEIFNILKEF